MIYSADIVKLDDYSTDDISDVINKIEKSFCIKFDKSAFKKVDDFGKLCDVIEANIKYNSTDDCTKQQAFYKVRLAISLSQSIDKSQIKLDTKLSSIFPVQGRRKQVIKFQRYLGVKLKVLTYPNWITLAMVAILIASVICFIYDWRLAVAGIAFITLLSKLADVFGKDLELETVKDLTEKAVREHYISVRRNQLSINRDEILDVVKDLFKNDLGIDKEYLTREASFDWTKSVTSDSDASVN